jgi:hypothetical protein
MPDSYLVEHDDFPSKQGKMNNGTSFASPRAAADSTKSLIDSVKRVKLHRSQEVA